MKRILTILALGALTMGRMGATDNGGSYTIEDCYNAAEKNYPLVRQYELIEKSKDYTISNAARAYLPQITFSAKASWQSDVTKFKVDEDKLNQSGFGGMISADAINDMLPTVSKDQYGASVDLTQTIWDGGYLKAQREVTTSESEAQAKNIEANLYALREKINNLYFGIILMQTHIDQYGLMLESLETNYRKVESYIENEVAGQADADALKVQILTTKQDMLNLENTKKAYIRMLSLLTGLEIGEDSELVKPEPIYGGNTEITRPELAAFDAQLKQIESQNRMINAGLTPKFGLYVSGGYGRPGLNMLDNSFQPYLVAGVKMTWNISNFYNTKTNRRLLENKKYSVQSQRDAFLLNTSIDVSSRDSEIETLRDQLAYDDEIVELRKSVLKANEAKMEQGTISGSDLVGYMNQALLADQNKTEHEIKMLLAMYNLKYVKGGNE